MIPLSPRKSPALWLCRWGVLTSRVACSHSYCAVQQGTVRREKSRAVVSLFRYFVLDFEAGLLQYFVNEQSKQQKPRGVLSLSGAIVSLSDEAPHMLVVYSANGEMYKLRGMFLFWRRREGPTAALRCCADQLFCSAGKQSWRDGSLGTGSCCQADSLSLIPWSHVPEGEN